jgi:hypothetical protein
MASPAINLDFLVGSYTSARKLTLDKKLVLKNCHVVLDRAQQPLVREQVRMWIKTT